MRKLKKINGYLVVRFNDREKREYEGTGLGNFGVIDAELYTGILDVDRSVMEYDDAETLEIALEQARGLESELDVVEPEVKITVIIEGETEVSEEDVEPESLFKGQRATLEARLKHGPHLDLDPLTAAHELHGYARALEDLGMIDDHDERFLVEHNTFGEVCNLYTDEGHRVNVALPSRAGLAIVSPHDFEGGETFTGCTVQTLKCRRCGMESFAWSKEPTPGQEEALAYICDEVCKYREGRTQEELDAICAKCKVDRWAGAPPTLTPQEVKNLRDLFRLAGEVSEYVNGGVDAPPERSVRRLEVKLPDHITPEAIQTALNAARDGESSRETFQNAPSGLRKDYNTKKVYALGLALAEKCPDNDCRVYLNIFNMARELDAALDVLKGNTAPALALRSALTERLGDLWEMYSKNHAVQQYKEGMKMTGLEFLRAPDTTAEQIADIVAEHCPPVTLEHCDKLSCRECWLAWLAKVETDREQSEKRTTPYRPLDKANERRLQHQEKTSHQCPPMRELRSLLEDWQRKNSAPYSALKVCFSAFLAMEAKNLSANLPPQDQEP